MSSPTDQSQPSEIKVTPVDIYFQNNRPTENEVDTIVDLMYKNPNHYEIINGLESAQDGNGFGLNQFIYYRTGLTSGSTKNTWILTDDNYSQYNSTGLTDQFGECKLNKNLFEVFGNPDTRKYYNIYITGGASKLYLSDNEAAYNIALGNRRIAAAKKLIVSKLTTMFGASVANDIANNNIVITNSAGSAGSSDLGALAANMNLKEVKEERRATISFKRNNIAVDKKQQTLTPQQQENIIKIQQDIQNLEVQLALAKKNITDNIYKERDKAILNSFESISSNEFYPVFHTQTPEDFHRRLTFLQQCTRQGAAKRYDIVDQNGELRARNSVFGKQPICILRIGDFFYTKIVIETVTIDYNDTTWDMNPEGFGMQPMIANITLQMKLIGGQSLKGPIDALQNAVTFNYYANSTFTNKGMYARPSDEANKQTQYLFGIDGNSGIIGEKTNSLTKAYDALTDKVTEGDQ